MSNEDPGREWPAASSALRAALLLAPFYWVVLGLLYVQIPPSPDQFFLDYTGWMTLRGVVPYEGFVDGNWPACHWLHAASTLLFGNTPHSWRVFDFLVLIASALVLADLARRVWGASTGLCILFLHPALYVVTSYWMSGQRDIFGANLCFGVLWCYWRGLSLRRPAWQVGAGLLLGFCALIKPTFALLGPVLLAHALISARAGAWSFRAALGQVVLAGASSVAGLVLGLGALLLQGVAFETFFEGAFRTVLLRFGTESIGVLEALSRALDAALASWHWIFGLAAVSFGIRLAYDGRPGLAGNLLFPAMWVAGLATYVAQGQALYYTLGFAYLALVPILCSGVGLALETLPRARGWRRWAALGCLLLVAGGTGKKLVGRFEEPARWLIGTSGAVDPRSRFDVGDGLTAAQAYALAEELASRTSAEETVLVWGRANAVNFLSERVQPTRFHHNVTLIRPGLPADLRDKYADWFRQDLEAARPAFCLVNQRELEEFAAEPSVTFLAGFLERDYLPERRLGEAILYRRKTP